jgi:hypothetical protein
MQMQNGRRSASLVKIIHILSDDDDVESGFELGQGPMRGVRLSGGRLGATLVVKAVHLVRIPFPGTGSSHILDALILPQSTHATERA